MIKRLCEGFEWMVVGVIQGLIVMIAVPYYTYAYPPPSVAPPPQLTLVVPDRSEPPP